jgi:tetratricopeptide (TPR) repeat protein
MQYQWTEWDEDVDDSVNPEEEYQALKNSLSWSKGFRLSFVQCPPIWSEQLIIDTRKHFKDRVIEVLRLDRQVDNLYVYVKELANYDKIDILFIIGIEASLISYIKTGYGSQGDYYTLNSIPPILNHLNLHRELFRDDFKIHFVFLLPFFAIKYFIRRAPDFYDWRSGLFRFPVNKHLLLKESCNFFEKSDLFQYRSLGDYKCRQKLLELESWLNEDYITVERKVELLIEKGIVFLALEKGKDAVFSYRKALTLNPNEHKAWFGLIFSLCLLEQYDEALVSYEKVLKIEPDNYVASYTPSIRYEVESAIQNQNTQFASQQESLSETQLLHIQLREKQKLLEESQKFANTLESLFRDLIKSGNPNSIVLHNNSNAIIESINKEFSLNHMINPINISDLVNSPITIAGGDISNVNVTTTINHLKTIDDKESSDLAELKSSRRNLDLVRAIKRKH